MSELYLQASPPSAAQINGFFRVNGAAMTVDEDNELFWVMGTEAYPFDPLTYSQHLVERIIHEIAKTRKCSPLTIYLEILQAPVSGIISGDVPELWKELSQGNGSQSDRDRGGDGMVAPGYLRLLGKT